MSSMCDAIHTLFSSITSFFSFLLSCILCNSRQSSTTVDLELGGVGPLKVLTTSPSPRPHTVDLLKVRDETDSPRIAMVVKNKLSGKTAPALEEFPQDTHTVTHKFTLSANDPFPRSPSTDSSLDDDRSSDGHSVESSFTSGGIAVDSAGKYPTITSLIDESPPRDSIFIEAMEGSLENHGETDGSSGTPSPQEGQDRDNHFHQFFSNVDINETETEIEHSSDDGINEEDSDLPAHRWLKFAIEFVWLHKLPNTIQELQEMEEEEIAREARGVRWFGKTEELREDPGFYAAGHTPEIIEHPPTPPTGPVSDMSLCRVKEVTEDLVDLLTSLKVTLRDSPTSFYTTTTSNKSDTCCDSVEQGTASGAPSPEPIHVRFSAETEGGEAFRLLYPESNSQDGHVGSVSDESSTVCSTGCAPCSCHISRPVSVRHSHSELESPA